METLRKTAENILSQGDSQTKFEIDEQMSILEDKWETVVSLSKNRRQKLDLALKEVNSHQILFWCLSH